MIIEKQIPGWRKGIADSLVANAPTRKEARAGYLSAFYALRALMNPPAFLRSQDTEAFQREINLAIREIEFGPDETRDLGIEMFEEARGLRLSDDEARILYAHKRDLWGTADRIAAEISRILRAAEEGVIS